MKYKNLKSMSHNFSHSFVSLMNYVDDGYVVDDLIVMAREAKGEPISVQWIPKKSYESSKFSNRVRKSIAINQDWLPKHLASHGVDESIIAEMRTDIFRTPSHQIWVKAYLKDNRGKEYEADVGY